MHVRAMENWGCITFADYVLLNDLETQPTALLMRNAWSIVHEIAHMWFGNLVTMDWWTDIWLNEGFARFMEFQALSVIHPEYNIWDQFLNEVYRQAIICD